ncbi:hypothetical protein OBBRIDRAFT_892001 [Obba rivulosa]|uniref:Uncharacterized protein n=1 Tax=Obba rivulosa TaxID=1052685 RepID=A0A8E2ANX1_9APHY|nr:hypothetical protein OBBRIDRAFT_892001 [Obba rivulosa]
MRFVYRPRSKQSSPMTTSPQTTPSVSDMYTEPGDSRETHDNPEGKVSVPDVLGPDIAYLIITMLARNDLLSFMRTCWEAYAECMKILLLSDIVLKDSALISGFCACVLKDASTRGPLLRSLSFPSALDKIPSENIRALCDVLSSARKLEKLFISNAHALRCMHFYSLSSVLTMFTELKVLEVRGAQVLGAELAQDIRIPLTHLSLDWEIQRPCTGVSMDTLEFLAPSLQVLKLTVIPPIPPSQLTFPSMHTLSFRIPAAAADIATFIRACPKLRSISCQTTSAPAPSVEALRQRHERKYAKLRWEHLDYVSADVPGLYQLALRQPTRSIDATMNDLSGHSIQWLTTVLTDMQPTHLQLHLDITADHEYTLLEDLLRGATRVTCLKLHFGYRSRISPEHVVSIVRSLSIKHLEIAGRAITQGPDSFVPSLTHAISSVDFVAVTRLDNDISIPSMIIPGEIVVSVWSRCPEVRWHDRYNVWLNP